MRSLVSPLPPGQDTEVLGVQDQGFGSWQQLRPGAQGQHPEPGTDGPLLLPALQTRPFKILCGAPGRRCRGDDDDHMAL